jgi:hypothetical protein
MFIELKIITLIISYLTLFNEKVIKVINGLLFGLFFLIYLLLIIAIQCMF